MRYKKKTTNNNVQLIHLKGLPKSTQEQCLALRQEAARLWNNMVASQLHDTRKLELEFKKGYNLHSQTIQALAQKLASNIDGAFELQKENPDAKLPYKEKYTQTLTWKKDGIRIRLGKLILSNGAKRPPLILPLLERYQESKVQQVELAWDVDHYVLCLNIDTGLTDDLQSLKAKTIGVDMGEIHIAACCTDKGEALVVSGRHLRSVKQLRNKKHANIASKQSKCNKGSRRWRKFQRAKNKVSSKFNRQQRDTLHKASRQVVNFCQEHQVANIALGDVRDISDGCNLGKRNNQKISQWAHGIFDAYLTYKSRFFGINTDYTPEPYTSKTCCFCGLRLKSSPRGRTFKCPGCGAIVHRDVNGGANICSRQRYGELGKVQPVSTKYLRPIHLGRSRPSEPRQVATGL